MSSDQYFEKPLPPESRKVCAYCGERIPESASLCWLCQEQYAFREGEPPASSHPDVTRDSNAWAVFGILAVLLFGALALEAPGLLIALVILAGPAMARALMVASRTDETAPQSPSFVMMFLNSLGMAAVVGVASFVAFFATCFVICLGGLGIGALDRGRGSEDSLLYCSVGGGIVVGLIVFALLFRKAWPR